MTAVMKKPKRRKRSVAFELLMILISLLIFYPIILMVLVSLKSNQELLQNPFGLSLSFQFQNYVEAFYGMDYLVALKNSVVLTAFSAVGCTLLAATAAYAIVRAGRGRKLFGGINVLFILGLALPQQVAMVPMVLWLQKLGLGGTLVGVIFVYIAANAAYGVFFFAGFVSTVPISLEEAAMIDGATRFTTFRKIVLPLLRTPMVTLLIIMILRVWNDFMYPLILLQGKNSRTLPLTVYLFKGDYSTQWNVMFAATTLVILPLMIIYFIFQRQIIAGMLSGSVKA